MSRVVIFTLVGFLVQTALGPVHQLLHMDMVVFDAPLVIVLYLAMAGRSGSGAVRLSPAGAGVDWTGGVVALTLGYISDVMGGGVKGLHCLTLVVVFLLARRAARNVYLAGTLPVLSVTLIASLVASLLGVGARWFGGVTPTPGSLVVVFVQAVLTAGLAPPVLRLCRLLDTRLLGIAVERGLSR